MLSWLPICSALFPNVQPGTNSSSRNPSGIHVSLYTGMHLFAMTCSIFIHHREACMMIYVFTSVPLLFISGISWPGTAIPKFWEVVSWLFPSTFGINGFVRINNMGATLTDVLTEYRVLWIQTGVYFLTTCIVYRRQITLSRRHVYERLKRLRKDAEQMSSEFVYKLRTK